MRCWLVALLLASSLARAEEPLTVFAAASLVDVLPQVADAWAKNGGRPVRFSFDASSRLAAQIEAGAPADVFVSADEAWMDALAGKHALKEGTRFDLLGNTLVLATPASSAPIELKALAGPKVRHVAVAAENVPAGRYARESLRALGLWEAVSPKVVNASDVRQALRLVASGEVDAAFVYATDAKAEPRVRISAAVPAEAHARIVYPVAATAESRGAAPFLAFLRSPPARRVFEAAGFTFLPAN